MNQICVYRCSSVVQCFRIGVYWCPFVVQDFWYDEKKELRSDFDALELPGIEKQAPANNEFGVKYRLLRGVLLLECLDGGVNVNYNEYDKALKKVPGLT